MSEQGPDPSRKGRTGGFRVTMASGLTTPDAILNQDDYTDKYVAFLDVLGFRALVESADSDPELRAIIRGIQSVLRDTPGVLPQTKTHLTQFSDSNVLSAPRSPLGATWIGHCVSLLAFNLINDGFLLRGGIAHGNLSHNDFGLFGPGLHKAYQGDRPGTPPRVVIEREIVSEFAEGRTAVKIDPYDGETMLHVLAVYEAYDALPREGDIVLDRSAAWIADLIRTHCADMALPSDVRAKWRWMRLYWNYSVAIRGILPSA